VWHTCESQQSRFISKYSLIRGAAHSACVLLTIGSNTPSVMLSTWYSNNSISENKRVVLTGVMVGIANASGLISGNVFQVRAELIYVSYTNR